jgi:hypothetical protein
VRPSRPKRRFTLEQANRALPLVRRVVADLVRTHAAVVKLQRDLERGPGGGKDGKNAKEVPPAQQQQLDAAMNRLEDFEEELSEIGCELKDYQLGLIDFVGRHQGRDVCLCWKLGEDKVAYFHEQDAGFAGRQPVSKLDEK